MIGEPKEIGNKVTASREYGKSFYSHPRAGINAKVDDRVYNKLYDYMSEDEVDYCNLRKNIFLDFPCF